MKEKGIIPAIRMMLAILFHAILYSLIAVVFVVMCKYGFEFSYQIFGDVTPEESPGRIVEVKVLDDQDSLAFARELRDKNLVVNTYSFYLRLRLDQLDHKEFRPGIYSLDTGMTYEEILAKVMKADT